MGRSIRAKVEDTLIIHTPDMVPVLKINPAKYNPRKISEADFAALKKSIRTYGFLDPIVVQRKGFNCVGGHQRVKAIKEICIEMGRDLPLIPAVILDISDRDAKKLNVMLNNVGGEFDARMLGELLAGLNKETPLDTSEIAFMGFEQPEVDRYLRLVDAIPPLPVNDVPTTFANSVTLSLEFHDVRLRDAVKQTLVDKARTTNQTTGHFIAALLGCRT